jgi:hypothetical protein
VFIFFTFGASLCVDFRAEEGLVWYCFLFFYFFITVLAHGVCFFLSQARRSILCNLSALYFSLFVCWAIWRWALFLFILCWAS